MATQTDRWFEKARRWPDASLRLRTVLLDCGLDEALKWGKPCYTADGKNIAIIQPMKDFVALMFFKGALLEDPKGQLEPPGANSNAARRATFTSVKDVDKMKAALKRWVKEAVAIEAQGLTVPKRDELVLCEELQTRLEGDKQLKAAFEALTPGRQRAYNLYISDAKQSKTRAARVEKHVERILAGKGLRD